MLSVITDIMKNENKSDWQPLRELAPSTPYALEYLSSMARKKQLKVKKIGRVWYSTKEHIKEFEDTMRERKEERKRQLRKNYQEKVIDETKIKIKVLPKAQYRSHKIKVQGSGATIFDAVQKELREVLQEIRERESKLRRNYSDNRGESLKADKNYQNERRIPIAIRNLSQAKSPDASSHMRQDKNPEAADIPSPFIQLLPAPYYHRARKKNDKSSDHKRYHHDNKQKKEIDRHAQRVPRKKGHHYKPRHDGMSPVLWIIIGVFAVLTAVMLGYFYLVLQK